MKKRAHKLIPVSQLKIPHGFCRCGCGGKTKISKWNNPSRGLIAGQPQRFIHGHHQRKHIARLRYDQKIGKGFCHCGCGLKTKIATRNSMPLGMIKGQPALYLSGHVKNCGHKPRYIIDKKTGCWVWQWHLSHNDYAPRINVNGRCVSAYRYYYEQKYGKVQDGLQIDHKCRNPSCVNPDHMEPVTPAENVRRGKNAKINVGIAGEVKKLLKTMSRMEVSRKTGVPYGIVYHISRGVSWKDVEPVA